MERILWTLRQFEPDRKTFEIIAVIMVVVTAILIYGFKGESQTITIDGEGSTVSSESATSEGTGRSGSAPARSEVIYVDVDGEVKNPGVYELSPGSRVFEAVDKAGGLKKKADTSSLNLAEKVRDGEKIMVPSENAEQSDSGGPSSARSTGSAGSGVGISRGESAGDAPASAGGGKININSASGQELQTINGIGPATAQKIIDYRNTNGAFKNTEELKNVNGIGDKTYEKMRPYVTV